MPGGTAYSIMMLLWGFPPYTGLPASHSIWHLTSHSLSLSFIFHQLKLLHLSVVSFSFSILEFHALLPLPIYVILHLYQPTPPTPLVFSSLSGTITPSVVAAKREQMLELLPTQCTKPPTAGLWILSLLLLHSHKEHRAVTPAPAPATTSHLQQGRVDRFTYTVCNVLSGKKEQ